MATNALIRSRFESGELVYRSTADNSEVLRIGPTGIDFPNAVQSDPWVFNVQDDEYGAVADGATDDTAAINAAVEAAFAYAQANETSYAEVYFPPSPFPYLLSSATTKGGAKLGNAQIGIPIQDNDARKVTLVFRGAFDASSMPYWEQDAQVRWGTTLRTTLTGQTVDSSWGVPSVIGGPAVSGTEAVYDGNDFNNVLLRFEGIGLLTPKNPSVAGLDFRSLAQLQVNNSSVMAHYSATGPGDLQGSAENDWSFGMFTPRHTNNDLLIIDNFSTYGQYSGLSVGEHAWVNRTASIYCHDGVILYAQQPNIHSSAFGSISVEASENGIWCIAGDENGYPIHVSAISMETIGTSHIKDPNNALTGEIHLTKLDGPTGIVVDGGDNVRVIAANQARGLLTAPSVPLTTVALKNPFWVDVTVLVSGGTVTQIAIDGENTGLTAGLFPVRSGGTLTLTYSAAPTWKWWGH